MAYTNYGGYPPERASNIGHIHLVENKDTRGLINQYVGSAPIYSGEAETNRLLIQHIDIPIINGIRTITTIDGGECPVNDQINPTRRLFFITVGLLKFDLKDLDRMQKDPFIDPRNMNINDSKKCLKWGCVIPLADLRIPNKTVKETIRKSIDTIFRYSGLYPILQFLTSREWDLNYKMGSGRASSFNCRKCGNKLYIPKSAIDFQCPVCGYPHTLSDYLCIDVNCADELARAETSKALRNVLEVLTLFQEVELLSHEKGKLDETLFVLDGPLMLRASLYRLVDDIRAYCEYLWTDGKPLKVIGVEKNGDIADFGGEIKNLLPFPGDFFLPTFRFVAENIHGNRYDAGDYRNRALFGVKVFARIGPNHMLAINFPVSDYKHDPSPEGLRYFCEVLSALSSVPSYQYSNALIPIVLVNQLVSISQNFSGNILEKYSSEIINRNSQEVALFQL